MPSTPLHWRRNKHADSGILAAMIVPHHQSLEAAFFAVMPPLPVPWPRRLLLQALPRVMAWAPARWLLLTLRG